MHRTKVELRFSDYRPLFSEEAYPASSAGCVLHGGELWLTFRVASDGDRGQSTRIARSRDLGQSWSTPESFGPPIPVTADANQSAGILGAASDGTLIAAGHRIDKGIRQGHYKEDVAWRPAVALIGAAAQGEAFVWRDYPSGTFLGEQFIAPALILASGRLILSVWGAKERGENWRCGVILSDDCGATWRYRDVAYERDKAIRGNREMPAGFNEQTLFALPDDRIVSIIRGRDALGQIAGASPHCSEKLFFRSLSEDGGESWSAPELTNLPGTGAPAAGLVLQDDSLLLPARIPTIWSRPSYGLFGLHFARSFDEGRTWQTELVLSRDPEGESFNNYYNAMNGSFVSLAPDKVLYTFGHWDPANERHRVLSIAIEQGG